MAVYTSIDEAQLKSTLADFDLGALKSFAGITDGVENTNYAVTTDKGKYILTLFEKRVNVDELPFYISYMEHLRRKGMPCAAIAETRGGKHVVTVAGKPALVTAFLDGDWPRDPQVHHCLTLGTALGHMHKHSKDFTQKRRNTMNLPAWESLIHSCRAGADSVEKGLFALLDAELSYLRANWPKYLPRGAVHADLFPDNVFFKGESLTGIIDFYFSCTDIFAYDLMLTLNAWCFAKDGAFNKPRAAALLQQYQSARALSRGEIRALPLLGRAAAVRIVATRLYDWLNPAPGATVKPKDPREHVHILKFHQAIKSAEEYGVII